jgi:lipoteichoic acid synthase
MAKPASLDRKSLLNTWPGAIIAGSSAVCFTVLVLGRLLMLHKIGYHHYWKLPAAAFVLSYQDFVVLGTLSCASLLLCLLSLRLRPCIAFTHCVLILFIASVGAINTITEPLYRVPVSVSLLDYSGALDFGSLYTLVGYLSVGDLVFFSLLFGLGSLGVFLTVLIIRKMNWHYPGLLSFSIFAALYVSFCLVVVPMRSPLLTDNAAVYFVRSMFESLPQLHSVPVNLAFNPYETELNTDQVLRDPSTSLINFSASAKKGNPSTIRNVVIFVLESVAAQYLDIYGGVPDTTPNLRSLLKYSLLFDSGYAHVPKTPVSMFSILTSVYPGMSANPLPGKNPQIALPTLTMRLKKKGFRTGIFLSADSRFGKLDAFLQDRGIDRVEDPRNRNCADASKDYLDRPVTPDRCTAASMKTWIEQSPEQPFFALMWTNQTHYPYSYGDLININEFKRGYLLGIREADAILQDFVDFLGKRNLLSSTLIVVIGDHGEGFGQHGVYVHGTEIYDEFVRIPFILINPVLFDGKVSHRNAGLIDVAPTVFALLGEPSPNSWQGLDLLGARSRKYNFSFVPWNNLKISLRTHEKRYIYDLINDRVQVFDMKVDPLETQDIGSTIAPDELEKIKLEITDWKQKQDQYLKQQNSDLSMSDDMNR